MNASSRLSPDRIRRAMDVIDPVFLNTPQFSPEALSRQLGCTLVVKMETLNPIRSFKGLGADPFVQQQPDATGLVCASAGNFGQGRLLFNGPGLLVESAGAPAMTALLSRPSAFNGRLVATVLCGSNMTPEQIKRWLI